MNRFTLKVAMAVVGVWTAVALITTSHLYVMTELEGETFDWTRALVQQFGQWYLWAAATPLVVWLAHRIQRSGLKRVTAISIHVAATLLIASAQIVLTALIAWATMDVGEMPPWPFWKLCLGLTYTLHLHVLVYGAIVGVTYAYDNYTRASQLEGRLASAQLEALRAQLQPHFLFNTLHGIAGLVRNGENAAATNMIAGLSDLLRASLDNSGRQLVPLEEELEFIGRYLEIQRMRFSDRLSVSIDASPETHGALVPNLVLQPLVENALRHGIANRAGAGTVVIRARCEDNWLCLSVLDDGPGLGSKSASANGGGIGLTNTRARLEQLYGDAFRFDVRDRDSGGVETALAIPLRTE